jgi:hypothetical protein
VAELPIVCTLQPGELNARASELLTGLVAAATRRVEIADGYRLEFPATSEILRALVAMIDAERQCCRFFRFQLTVEPDGGPFSLEVSGPPGAGEFLGALLRP